jgi:hypothetical protein
MEAGDLVEIEGHRWLVTGVVRKVATLRSAAVAGLQVPSDTPATVVANPARDWIYVPVKLMRGRITRVRRPLPGGLMMALLEYTAWVDAGAGIYVSRSTGLGRGDILHVEVNGRVQQVRVKSTDSLSRRVRRVREPPPAPRTVFDRLMQDDDDE